MPSTAENAFGSENVWATGSHCVICRAVLVLVVSVVVDVVWLTTFLETSAFLVEIIVVCFVSKRPLAANIALPSVPGSVADPTVLLVELEVNLNSNSPVVNCGLPATLGSGICNLPFALPTASVTVRFGNKPRSLRSAIASSAI